MNETPPSPTVSRRQSPSVSPADGPSMSPTDGSSVSVPDDAPSNGSQASVSARPGVLDWVLTVGVVALAMVIGVFGVFFLPVYSGSTPLPFVVVFIGGALVILPRLSYGLTRRMWAAVAPVLGWLAVTIWLYVTNNALYLDAAVAWRGWQFALLLGIGSLSAAGSVGLLWGDHLRAEILARPAAEQAARNASAPRQQELPRRG